MRRIAWAAAALLLAAGCGTGTDGKPVAPPTTPAPTPEPPPEPPTVSLAAWVVSQPSDSAGYYVGEKIQVVLDFRDQRVSVEGSPRLAIEIGEHVRLADFSPPPEEDWFPEKPSQLQWFEYVVASEDADPDGISIQADALDFSEGAFLNEAGVEVGVEIHTVNAGRNSSAPDPAAPGEDLFADRVVGQSPPRVCTDERQRARTYGAVIVDEWDGTPFRVDLIRNFPDGVTDADLVGLLDAVGLLADKIERQIGYRLLEMGDVIPVPAGVRPGWNQDIPEFVRTCPIPRERGQIPGFYMDDSNPWHPRSDAQAHPHCGDYAYSQLFMTYFPCRGCEDARTSGYGHFIDGVTLHEMFHLFGFIHTEEHARIARGEGAPMSWQLRNVRGPDAEAVLWADIDALRCIFPESE